MPARRILVTGAAGQLASDLLRRLPGAVGLTRDELDITNLDEVKRAVERTSAELVFNCAAYNGVDQAEREPDIADSINAIGPGNVAVACAEADARCVHFSTNFVFDGRRPEPYDETDEPHPLGAYARSKRRGEEAVLAVLPTALVIRSSGLFGLGGSAIKGGSFPERILARAQDREAIRVVSDQMLNPTYTGHLAEAAIAAVDGGLEGVVHLVAAGCCSYFDFAAEILAQAGVDVRPEAVTGEGWAAPAPRPANGCLVSRRHPPLPPWQAGVRDFLASAASR